MRLSASATAKKKQQRLTTAMTAASTKKMLPCTPFLTSAATSCLASSTSARTSVETCVVTSLTRVPTDASPFVRAGSAWSGMEGTTGGLGPPVDDGEVTGPPGGGRVERGHIVPRQRRDR